MRLLILTQYWPPEMGAPQVRLPELGEQLVDLGWGVECLTALPNYPTGKVFSGYQPDQCVVETVGRIRTARVPLKPAKSGFLRRLRCYFSFVYSCVWFGPGLVNRPDLLLVESPPLFIGFAARYLSRKWKCPYVFNVSDLWPESAVRMGIIKDGFLARRMEQLELFFYRGAAGVTGQSSEIIESVRARAPATRTTVITNGVDPSKFEKNATDPSARELVGTEPGPVFTYAGLLGLAQGLDQVLDLAKTLPDDIPGRFVLVGDGPMRDHLRTRIENEAISRVKLLPSQPRFRIPAILGSSDAVIITLRTDIPGAVPSKIYEAMASGLAILLASNGEGARRVNEVGCGLTVPSGDPVRLREAFIRLVSEPGLRREMAQAGRKAAETTYNRKLIAARLDAFLRECAGGTGPSCSGVGAEGISVGPTHKSYQDVKSET